MALAAIQRVVLYQLLRRQHLAPVQPVKTILTPPLTMSVIVGPKPVEVISGALTLTEELESPRNVTLGNEANVGFTTEFDTSIAFTDAPAAFLETKTTPATTTTAETTPTTSQTPVTVTVTKEEEDGPPVSGFMSLLAILGLIVVVLVFSKRRT